MTFLDSNVLVYAIDRADARKHRIALDIVAGALERPRGWLVSTQVLSEFSNVLVKKLACPVPRLLAFLDQLSVLECFDVNSACVRRAAEIQSLYGLQFYDAQIIAAAEAGGCEKVYSEDFNPGQAYCGVIAENPFA